MKEYYENNKIALFEKHKKYRQKNREKLSAQKKEYTLKNKKKLANKECLRKYGITLEEKSVQNIQQNNLCLGCRGKMGKNIVVDHDHITGKVRGLLHSNCNVILGYVHDNPETLRSLAAYLESSL